MMIPLLILLLWYPGASCDNSSGNPEILGDIPPTGYVQLIRPVHLVIIITLAIYFLLIVVASTVELLEWKPESKTNFHWLYKFLLCFGLRRNLSYLFRTTPLTDSRHIHCLHGIRVVAFFVIAFYHVRGGNRYFITKERTSPLWMQPLVTGYIFVDAFLLMSGLLVARSILNAKAENRSIRAILTGHPRRLLHRYIRLTPSLLAILLAVILLELTGNHKFVWFVQTKLPQYWWRIFLYTTNYSISNGFLTHLWYLGVDMQYFLVSPLLVMCLASDRTIVRCIGVGINVAVLAISWIVTAVLSAQINPVDNPAYLAQYLSQVYCSPVCHITPYCIGILLAYWIHKEGEIGEEDCEGNSKWPVAHLILAAILMLAVTFLPVLWHNKRLGNSLLGLLYSTFHQSIFAFAWALVIWILIQIGAMVLTILLALVSFVSFEKPFMNLLQTFLP